MTRITGVVNDPSGAATPGVEVKITEERTGFTASAKSNDTGQFEFSSIPAGSYTIEAQGTGFKKFKNTGVIVYVRVPRRVDIALQVGDVVDTVTVEAEGARIATETAAITYKAPNQEVYSFNVQGWLIYRLDLSPGTEARSQVHGGYANNTQAQQDGLATNAYGNYRAPQELIQEVNQVTMNAPAEYRTSATVIGVSKSGTNTPHGEVFLNLNHPRLGAVPGNTTIRPRPQTPQKTWNYEFSGPIYVPKIYDGRNKSFFRFMYQPFEAQWITFQDRWILPTTRMRGGDASEYAAFTGKPIIDPFPELHSRKTASRRAASTRWHATSSTGCLQWPRKPYSSRTSPHFSRRTTPRPIGSISVSSTISVLAACSRSATFGTTGTKVKSGRSRCRAAAGNRLTRAPGRRHTPIRSLRSW
ncbi:MAG: carboxypeptidase-like regulatory domain-containing protein [Bryobacteraceae bacterium]